MNSNKRNFILINIGQLYGEIEELKLRFIPCIFLVCSPLMSLLFLPSSLIFTIPLALISLFGGIWVQYQLNLKEKEIRDLKLHI